VEIQKYYQEMCLKIAKRVEKRKKDFMD